MQAVLKNDRPKWTALLAPGFLLLLLLGFVITPGTTLDKLNMICFGI